jgi:hypothetical protein
MALSAIMGPTSEETGFIRLRLRYSSCVPISGDPNHDVRTAGSGNGVRVCADPMTPLNFRSWGTSVP